MVALCLTTQFLKGIEMISQFFFLRFFSWNVSLQFAFTPLRQGGVIPETRKVCSTHLVMKC